MFDDEIKPSPVDRFPARRAPAMAGKFRCAVDGCLDYTDGHFCTTHDGSPRRVPTTAEMVTYAQRLAEVGRLADAVFEMRLVCGRFALWAPEYAAHQRQLDEYMARHAAAKAVR